MMKALHISTVSIAIAMASAAADSPLRTAADYVFSRPFHTNSITGKVMGDLGDDRGGVLRSEDLAFLCEAAYERSALAFGWDFAVSGKVEVANFGKWPLSATNQFSKYTLAVTDHEFSRTNSAGGSGAYISTTNIVVGYTVVTNALGANSRIVSTQEHSWDRTAISERTLPIGDALRADRMWIDPKATFREGWVTVPRYSATTNVVTHKRDEVSLHFMTNTIVQTMTNGSVDVHLNILPVWKTNSVTEVSTHIRDLTEYDHLSTTGIVEFLSATNIHLSGPYSRTHITNAFAAIRRMRRICGGNPMMTNDHYTITRSNAREGTSYEFNGTEFDPFDRHYREKYEHISDWVVNISWSASKTNYRSWNVTRDGYLLKKEITDSRTGEVKVYQSDMWTGTDDIWCVTPVEEDVRTYGGKDRIGSCLFFVGYEISADGYYLDNGYWRHWPTIWKAAAGTVDGTNSNGRVKYRISAPSAADVLAAAASAVGITVPSGIGDVPSAETPPWPHIDDITYVGTQDRSRTESYGNYIAVRMFAIYSVVDLNPTTKLQNWE